MVRGTKLISKCALTEMPPTGVFSLQKQQNYDFDRSQDSWEGWMSCLFKCFRFFPLIIREQTEVIIMTKCHIVDWFHGFLKHCMLENLCNKNHVTSALLKLHFYNISRCRCCISNTLKQIKLVQKCHILNYKMENIIIIQFKPT